MEITPDQLLYLRKQRGLTRDELANELKCSASAIVHWEGGTREIPPWVADKMFSKLPVEFSVEELTELFDICRELKCTIGELLGNSARSLITERRDKQVQQMQAEASKQSHEAEPLPEVRPFYHRPDLTALVAEDPPSGTTADPYRAAARDFLQKNSPASPPPAPGSAAVASHPRSRGTPPPKRAGK